MQFRITEEEARDFAALEASVGCDIGAGPDWESNLGAVLAAATSTVNHQQLVELLHSQLGSLLGPDEIEQAVCQLQDDLKERILRKYSLSQPV